MFEDLFEFYEKESNDLSIFRGLFDTKADVIQIYGSIESAKKMMHNILKSRNDETFIMLYSSFMDANVPTQNKNGLYAILHSFKDIYKILNKVDKKCLDFLFIDNISLLISSDEENRETEFSNDLRRLIDLCKIKRTRLIFGNSINMKKNPYGISYQVNKIIDETIKCISCNDKILLANIKNSKKKVVNCNEL